MSTELSAHAQSIIDNASAGVLADVREIVARALNASVGSIDRSHTKELEILDRLLEKRAVEITELRGTIVRLKNGLDNVTRAGLDVIAERARQREKEGYDDSHDDLHDPFELASAAIAYVQDARLRAATGSGFDQHVPADWRWHPHDWKPKPIRRSLEVAAALIIAEMEKIDREQIFGSEAADEVDRAADRGERDVAA